ncbi:MULTISPECIES: 1-deoxy-D-xylulose-5-phosphate reductoisomerase [unclassified Colwellia]|uniref:1-deoxy-D-xylulose-5-phosphate reductoisomerase n=1 Tax=unclassified Colwellia TaxID=196834 RepID=UPI0015F465F5|nr:MULTISPECIES: 1-deoxy-D-xylulose-5-phosphate reductoisomerase [unclassified Colwellia]MBA6351061.1 1-deoxy-D-xylulose-5-phosphate reductoisomerase [Colwellia sp. BRX9-1]MBA6378413.1 1-deoxy-D-xylulose-5-phosphate reductoisomerase [Colwellia sp. BRX10-7]MBA6386747.1 1-deoxy-D-xylulose-5-phosphate reductoisomerase [Colwellia sp. BRX10-2]MBA6400354.1 1-deoxy-D-xylulose-5-phosphate reductoisomerase [Colwellia sp. BRX10-5]MBA6404962.1 1-deoxy-D-xylulose-5-phosphate reductoisomerase [Colwellia sp
MRKLCILGSTGSIGVSTLEVVRLHPTLFSVESLSANTRVDEMLAQCLEFKPSTVVMVAEHAAQALKGKLDQNGLQNIEVLSGGQGLIDIAQADTSDTVMAAIVGASGLLSTMAAVKSGKRVLLANKEALVTSGALFIDAVEKYGAELLPIDSEHNAIFQCLPANVQAKPGRCDLASNGVSKILLTGSGGPFRTFSVEQLAEVTPAQACAHPNWEMGRKISVDSATMMNKGLEFIEAKWLFNIDPDDIHVVLHPQSTIHSMVQYKDGSVIAQMGNPDMRTPIAHALAYPQRIDSGVAPLDFFNTPSFEFEDVDYQKYPNLKLAIAACKSGQGACTALNAANEIAVDAFLNEKIKFTDIAKINETSVNKFVSERVASIDDVVALDASAREFSRNLIASGCFVVNDVAINEVNEKGNL